MLCGRITTGAILLGLAFLMVGCGRSGPRVTTVDVSGTVYLDNQPLEGINVFFIGEGAQFVGIGKTDSSGRYQLDQGSIPGKRGAMPGRNQVYFAVATEAEGPPMIPGEEPEPPKGPLPAKYSDPVNPELTFDVPPTGTQEADFQLSSK